MTASLSVWHAAAQRLVDQLTAEGDLHDPAWRAALLAVPRHEFVPRYYLQDTSTRPSRWVLHEPGTPQTVRQWLDLVYSPTTLITAVAAYADRGVQIPVSSSTKPDLMVRMLEALDVRDGHRVLEIGTGTGYNAALLAHRLGAGNVYSIDIDPQLVATAQERLAALGLHPTLVAGDGVAGLAGHGPYDRIIATCSVTAIPAAWIRQLTPGGLVLVHLEGPLGAGNLAALHRGQQPVLSGHFLPWWGCFMRRRTTAGPTTGTPRPTPTTQPATLRSTTLDPAALEGDFAFLAQLHLPAGMFRSIRLADDERTPVSYLAAPDGSWCEITRQPDTHDRFTVREAGPTPLWTTIETAWTQWNTLGKPTCHEFGLTATAVGGSTEHRIWYRNHGVG